MDVKVVAHRGFSGLWPENSMIAFQKAVDLQPDAVESDLQLTADGHIVLMHDLTIDRTTDGQGVVSDMTLDELRQFKIKGATGDHQLIPTLEEKLDIVKPTNLELRLDIKKVGLEEQLVETIKAYGLEERATIITFFPSTLRKIKSLNKAIRTSMITTHFEQVKYEDILPYIDGIEAYCCSGDYYSTAFTKRLVKRMKDDGLLLDVWTVDTEEHFNYAMKFEPDYITTNYPHRIMKLLNRPIPDWAAR